MTRLAFGAKCSCGKHAVARRRRRRRPANRSSFEQRRQRGGADAGGRAAEELAAGEEQFVFADRGSSVVTRSILGHRLVEVQDHAGHRRPGGQLGRRRACRRAATRRRSSSFVAASASLPVTRRAARRRARAAPSTPRPLRLPRGRQAEGEARSARPASAPPSVIIRSASLRDAST